MTPEILIVAAEASSAHYAEKLLQYWKDHKVQVKAFGVGTDSMERMGFERMGRAEDMAVVGLAEVIEHFGDLKKVFNALLEQAKIRRPKVALVLDYPDFNLRLAAKLKEMGIPVVYYIAPQVWFWRKGRVKQIKAVCDQVFVLFPFEKDFYDQHQVKTEFVGHPLLDDIDPQLLDHHSQNAKRARFGIREDDVLLGIMPGSRKGELRMNLPMQVEVASQLVREIPVLKFAILVAPTFTKEVVQAALDEIAEKYGGRIPFSYILLKNDPLEMICLVDVMLAASGTATLQVGLLHKPMVIIYRFKTLTYWLARAIVGKSPRFGLPNLVLGELVVPELVQAEVSDVLAATRKFLVDETYRRHVQKRLGDLEGRLGSRGATERVAKALMKYWQGEQG